MIKNIKNVIIVGGGSAGWMSAALLCKIFPNYNITVIESPNYPIIGVGESTLQSIKDYTHLLEIDEKDFMQYTDASYKLSIKFTDFKEIGDGGFHYPFGHPILENTVDGMRDWFVKKALYPNTPNNNLVASLYPSYAICEQAKFTKNNKKYSDFQFTRYAAYHFDATKFGQWLKNNYAIPRGVSVLSDTVKHVEINDNGVKSLTLESGNNVSADLYIDCTGFKSLLLGTALQTPFKSYSHMLPNNRAWATRLPYKNKDEELQAFTNCTALTNGWVWNIPSWERIGTGYVYSDKFVDPEDALIEFKKHLTRKQKYQRSNDEINELEYKDIPMKVGIHEKIFVKNVVAIGLSAGFIEPLESNGLFSVHHFLTKLCKILLPGTITQFDRDMFNAATRGMFDNFAQFVALHYATSHRNDSDYWIANANRTYDPGLSECEPTSSVGFFDFQNRKMFTRDLDIGTGITWISTGLDRHIFDKIDVAIDQYHKPYDFKNHYANSFTTMEINQQKWWSEAKNELSLTEYLKRFIYN